MKKLSFWSRDHKTSARILIVVGYLILNMAGLFLGDLLHSFTGNFNAAIILIPIILTMVGYFFYPDKKNKNVYKNFYSRQKLNDGFLVFATFLFLVFAGNKLNENTRWSQSASALSINYPISKNSVENKTVNTKPQKGTKAYKNFKHRIKALRKAYKESSKSEKTLMIIGVVLLAGAVGYGLAAVACGISCSGSEALAIVVFVVGLGGIIFGAVKLIQRITRGPKKPRTD